VAEEKSLLGEVYTPLATVKAGSSLDQVFLVEEISHSNSMVTSRGEPFARLRCKDISGTIEGVVWNYENDLRAGDFVHMSVVTKQYKGSTQFETQGRKIAVLKSPPLNLYDFVRGVSESVLMSYSQEVQDTIMEIDDDDYRQVMHYAMHNLDLMHALMTAPYGLEGPMAYPGGLLLHATHSLRFAKVACQQAKTLEIDFSPSLVVAACILRTIGWSTTTIEQRPRDAYYMTGIYRASARYIDHLLLSCEADLQIQISESKKQALENVCNRYDEIKTLEGHIVSRADNMADVLDFGQASLLRSQKGSWRDGFFVGHIGSATN
jgi:hypothetical protein